jgi:methanogenic corrinoid protein MtbC1
MLGAVLLEEGVQVHTLVNTFSHPLTKEVVVEKAREVKADWVGISMLTFQVLWVYELVAVLKQAGFKVVLGGAHPTDCPEEGITAGADVVVCG